MHSNYPRHSSKEIIGTKSGTLKGKTIVLGVTGSVAAVKAFDLCRELMRRGADVQVVMTRAALDLVGEQAMHFASGNPVITRLTGEVEHVGFCGIGGKAGLLLIAPSTANTIGKIAWGVDDTTVTTFAATALGSRIPILVVPAMHGSMYEQPVVMENIRKLEKVGVKFVLPEMSEGKAKFPEIREIAVEAERALGGGKLAGRKIVVTGGGTIEPIDDVRVIGNKASGKTGREIALAAYREGAEVTLIEGKNGNAFSVRNVNRVVAETSNEMEKALNEEVGNGADAVVMSAAVGDFVVDDKRGKLKSRGPITLTLKPRLKLIGNVKRINEGVFVVGFKAEAGVSRDALERSCLALMERHGLDMVVGNDVADNPMGADLSHWLVVNSAVEEPLELAAPKPELAAWLVGLLARRLERLENRGRAAAGREMVF